MHGSRRTGFLVAAAAALLLVHFFPSFATPVAWLALAAGALWIALISSRLILHYRNKRFFAAQEAADEIEYVSFQTDLNALRARFDPGGEWHGSTDDPAAYRNALSTLHATHRAMLERRFGPGATTAEGGAIEEAPASSKSTP